MAAELDMEGGAANSKTKVLMFVTEDWYFLSHRLSLAMALAKRSFRILVGCRINDESKRDEHLPVQLFNMPFHRSLKNPIWDIYLGIKMATAVRREQPNIVHLVALKPIISSIFALCLNPDVKFIHAFAGMGYLFTSRDTRAKRVRYVLVKLLRFILRRKNSFVLVQNLDDKEMLLSLGVTEPGRITLIPGSGIKCENIYAQDTSEDTSTKRVVLPARMIRDKGILEFVAAARIIRKNEANVKFQLVGGLDLDNPAAIQKEEIEAWTSEGAVEWLGHETDMNMFYSQADIVCLPSYREGLPKVLLEAGALGKAIVASDVPGCRDICIHEQSGLLVQPGNVASLVEGIQRMLNDGELRQKCGLALNELVRKEFSLPVITKQTERYYQGLVSLK